MTSPFWCPINFAYCAGVGAVIGHSNSPVRWLLELLGVTDMDLSFDS